MANAKVKKGKVGGGGEVAGARCAHLSWTEHMKGGARSSVFAALFCPDSKVHPSTAA